MNKNYLILFSLAIVFSISSCTSDKAPNIVMVIANDMTWNDCEPYGSTNVKTPNINRLASKGMVFDNMFTSTAMPTPSKQQLFTGLYPVRNGAFANSGYVYEEVKTLPTHFAELGYRMGYAGKKDFGSEQQYPFEDIYSDDEPIDKQVFHHLRKFMLGDETKPFFLVVSSQQPAQPWDMNNNSDIRADSLKIPSYLVDTEVTRNELVKYYTEVEYLDWQLGNILNLLDDDGHAKNTIVIFATSGGAELPFAKWTCYDRGLKTAFIMRYPKKIKAGKRISNLTQYVDVLPTLIELAGGDPEIIDAGKKDTAGKNTFDGISFRNLLKRKKEAIRNEVYGVQTSKGIPWSSIYPIRSVRDEKFLFIKNLNFRASFESSYTKGENSFLFEDWVKKSPKSEKAIQAYRLRPQYELYYLENDPNQTNNLADNGNYSDKLKEMEAKLTAFMTQQGDQGVQTEIFGSNNRR